MPMQYEYTAIPDGAVPRAANPVFQHLLDTYASETSKVISVWREFSREDMAFKPAERSSTVADVMKHQLLSERRFFAEFIGLPGEPEPADVVVPLRYRRGDQELAFFSMTAVVGTPMDVTIDELAIESFYPADRSTAEALWADRD